KCRAAKVDLPEPETPTRTTSDSSGTLISATVEHSHLGRGPDFGVFAADAGDAEPVAVALGDLGRPGGEPLAVPFEAVVGVAEMVLVHAVADVVLHVGRGDHDGAGPGGGEDDPLDGGEPAGIDVLDDPHAHCGGTCGEAPVAVDPPALEPLEAFGHALGH